MNHLTSEPVHISSSPQRRLLGFVLCSVTLHGLFLTAALWKQSPETPSIGQPVLQVRVEMPARSSRTSSPRSLLAPQSEQRVNEATRESPDDLVSNRTETVAPADHGANDNQVLQNYLRGALQSELSRHLRYPRLARERGWQGTVVVRVMIAPDGALIATRLFHSSGHTLLDEASLAGLSRVRSLPVQAAARQTDPVEVILPIQFRLTDNT